MRCRHRTAPEGDDDFFGDDKMFADFESFGFNDDGSDKFDE